jgi:hypothetical protein
MKRQTFSLVSLLSLLLVAGSAIAQTVHVRANIPFNFAVGSKTLPAGTYDVGTIDGRDSKMLLLQARDGNSSMIVGSNAAENFKPADKTKLVFNQYGSRYFLSEIWVDGELEVIDLDTVNAQACRLPCALALEDRPQRGGNVGGPAS